MGEIMVTTATGSRSILFLFPSLSSCPDSLRWITNQRDCSHWPQQGLTNAVFHCKLEVRISRCVFLTSYSYRPMHLLRKNMDAPHGCLNGNYSSWFNSQGNLKNVTQNEQYIKQKVMKMCVATQLWCLGNLTRMTVALHTCFFPPRVQSNRLSNAVRPSPWCVSNDSVIVVMKVWHFRVISMWKQLYVMARGDNSHKHIINATKQTAGSAPSQQQGPPCVFRSRTLWQRWTLRRYGVSWPDDLQLCRTVTSPTRMNFLSLYRLACVTETWRHSEGKKTKPL